MSEFEVTARAAKAQAMADLLVSFGISAVAAERLNDDQWRAVANAADCKPPNSETTKRAVYAAMKLTASESSMTVAQWKTHVEATASCQ